MLLYRYGSCCRYGRIRYGGTGYCQNILCYGLIRCHTQLTVTADGALTCAAILITYGPGHTLSNGFLVSGDLVIEDESLSLFQICVIRNDTDAADPGIDAGRLGAQIISQLDGLGNFIGLVLIGKGYVQNDFPLIQFTEVHAEAADMLCHQCGLSHVKISYHKFALGILAICHLIKIHLIGIGIIRSGTTLPTDHIAVVVIDQTQFTDTGQAVNVFCHITVHIHSFLIRQIRKADALLHIYDQIDHLVGSQLGFFLQSQFLVSPHIGIVAGDHECSHRSCYYGHDCKRYDDLYQSKSFLTNTHGQPPYFVRILPVLPTVVISMFLVPLLTTIF